MKRRAKIVSSSLERRLNMYALAASAAGVGVLITTQAAEGKIVYTSADKQIPPHHAISLDLNHDGKVDFVLSNTKSCQTDICFYNLLQKPAAGNSGIGYVLDGQLFLASALKSGANIGSAGPFQKGAEGLVEIVRTLGGQSTNVFGPWQNVKKRYLGLQFQIKGKTHYGWARLNVAVSKTTINGTLTGYAYETTANKPIIAGKSKGRDDKTPPPSLGRLARGVVGIPAERK